MGSLESISLKTQLFIDMLGDAFLCATTEGLVIGANEAACRMLGYSRAEIIALCREDLVVPGDGSLEAMIAERQRSGAARGRLTLVRKGGERFEVDAGSFVVPIPGGEPQLWLVMHDILERRRVDEANAALAESVRMLRALSEAAFEAILVHRDGKVVLANGAAEIAAGVAPGQLVGRALFDFIAPVSHEIVRAKVAAGDEQPYESFGMRADGTVYPLEVRVRNTPVQLGGMPARVVALRDLTARKQLEEEFRQAQKMEAVGRLAGGVAHDFNNMLVVILSGIDHAAHGLPESHPSRLELEEVRQAALRAKELTRDLLALGRKQVLKVRVVEVGAVVARLRAMLRRLIGEDIELVVDAASKGLRAQLDESQLEIVLMNLVVNARDAMPRGGQIHLQVRAVDLDARERERRNDLPPGPYVRITVSDCGCGMDPATRARIFEPFFTTKPLGQGTGLGLSTVFGIVTQSGGHIGVDSDVGRGTTFTLHFPRTNEAVAEESPAPPDAPAVRRKATVLVVEDEVAVRRIIALCLRQSGYEVLEAVRPDAALELVRTREGPIDLLLTDLVMPGMTGRQLSEQLVKARPGLRVLYVSGYTEDAMASRGMLDAGVHFLQKPFTGPELVEVVARVMR